MTLKLKPEARAAAIESMLRYGKENFEEGLGALQAGALVDFFVEEVAPHVYNQAIADAQARLAARVADLDIECFEEAGTYWTRRKSR
jgi:uncharacterized protein (DUF2164 family)